MPYLRLRREREEGRKREALTAARMWLPNTLPTEGSDGRTLEGQANETEENGPVSHPGSEEDSAEASNSRAVENGRNRENSSAGRHRRAARIPQNANAGDLSERELFDGADDLGGETRPRDRRSDNMGNFWVALGRRSKLTWLSNFLIFVLISIVVKPFLPSPESGRLSRTVLEWQMSWSVGKTYPISEGLS